MLVAADILVAKSGRARNLAHPKPYFKVTLSTLVVVAPLKAVGDVHPYRSDFHI